MKKKTNDYWDRRALERLTDSELISEAHIKQIKAMYNQAFKNIDEEIRKVYKNYSKATGLDIQKLKTLLSKTETDKTWKTLKRQGLDKYIKDNYKARITRLEQLQAQIYARAKQIYSKEEMLNKMAYKGVINSSYYKTIYDIQMGTGFDVAFNKLSTNAETILLNEKWSGRNYSETIWKNTDILADSLSETLGGAILSGQGVEKTAKQIKDRFNVGKYYAERLVRTETNHFYNEATALAYEKLGVDKYVFVATLDSRTSEMCQDMDNVVKDYKDKEVGVNFPPLHPNCRSTTRGYIGEEEEKMLERRARNPITGKTEIVENISYKEWIKKYNLDGKRVKTSAKPSKKAKITEKTALKGNEKAVISINDLPSQFNTPKELKNSQILIDYINNKTDANKKVAKVYSLMGKSTKYDFKLSHAKKHSLARKENIFTGGYSDVKLTIPNLTDLQNPNGTITSVLHELMHFIDFNNGKYTEKSIEFTSLKEVVKNTDSSMSDEIKALFESYNKMCKNTTMSIGEDYKNILEDYRQQYLNGKWSYDEYSKAFNKTIKERDALIDYEERNAMGGSVGGLQDIYDALSGGKYRDNGTVRFGHGSKYYSSTEKRVKEIVANYGSLSITRPDLIELLKADKPELVKELDKLMDEIIKQNGG